MSQKSSAARWPAWWHRPTKHGWFGDEFSVECWSCIRFRHGPYVFRKNLLFSGGIFEGTSLGWVGFGCKSKGHALLLEQAYAGNKLERAVDDVIEPWTLLDSECGDDDVAKMPDFGPPGRRLSKQNCSRMIEWATEDEAKVWNGLLGDELKRDTEDIYSVPRSRRR
ncbi:hypothetical protein B0H10DRAFT_1940741 [Mycena sp. CBHHK59/15]|nr:hypothetical protein B0H10DRAFT_1954861 [Mycena sp. CBHHK59/15]KAJ6628193.1 hypothetical protein B0H10DRAFT_1940741 [Mycena sp. CBHHK59/15]